MVKQPPCGAKTRGKDAKNPTCHRPAGWGTDHAGHGRCKFHGGAVPLTHGRYASLGHIRLRDLIKQQEQDPDPLNILPELAAARALFIDFVERYADMTAAILAWHESFEATRIPLAEDKVMAFEGVVNEWEISMKEGRVEPTSKQMDDVSTARAFLKLLRGKGGDGGKPRQVLDIADAYRIVGEITKIAERQWKRQDANAISRKDLNRVIDQMGRAVMKHVPDPDTLKAIRNDWLSLSI